MKVIKVVSHLVRNTVNLIIHNGKERMIFAGYESAAEARVNRTLANQFVDGDEYEVVDTRQANRGTLSATGGKR